jgi:ATP-dependent exoDNAse (exonuclease V) alpha subunit
MLLERYPIQLSKEFSDILQHIEETDDSMLVTGKAGTGKSTLLSILRRTTLKRVAVVAPTGIAALNVKGQTIHSFFKFPPKMMMASDIKMSKNPKLYRNIDVLVIDEISMVRADLLDNIDRFLRINRKNAEPFGGVQVVFFGDMFQLPPVVSSAFEKQVFRDKYDSPYFFSANVMQEVDFPLIELHTVYRQSDRHFVGILDRVRTNTLDQDDLDTLNAQVGNHLSDDDLFITLTSSNAAAMAINQSSLAKLPGDTFKYPAKVEGVFQASRYPADQLLQLKEGAQVIFVKNDTERRWVNGTLGKVTSISKEDIVVSITDPNGRSTSVTIFQEEWEILKYKVDEKNPKKFSTEVVGVFRQYPIKLAWAITIHKSQGQTFDKVRIDLGRGAFEFGQTYVALSRCRTLEGIELSRPLNPRDIMSDNRIAEYYQLKRFYW